MSPVLEARAIRPSEIPFINRQYLYDCHRTSDPTMVWGTDVDVEELLSFVKQCNQSSDVVVSVAHVLVKAVAVTLAKFPDLNCRIVGRRIYRFRDVNVRLVSLDRKTSEVDILTLPQADKASLQEIGRTLWEHQMQLATNEGGDRADKALLRRWCPDWLEPSLVRLFWWLDRNFRLPRIGRIDRHLDSSVVVNHLAYAEAPPMRMYKPSKFVDETSLLSVTLGGIQETPVVREGRVVVGRVAPLFVRMDHRVTDAHRLSYFVRHLRESLSHPATLQELKPRLPHENYALPKNNQAA